MAKVIPDSIYLRMEFLRLMKKPLNLKDPKTFNEKLQWLKLHDRKPESPYKNVKPCILAEKYIEGQEASL